MTTYDFVLVLIFAMVVSFVLYSTFLCGLYFKIKSNLKRLERLDTSFKLIMWDEVFIKNLEPEVRNKIENAARKMNVYVDDMTIMKFNKEHFDDEAKLVFSKIGNIIKRNNLYFKFFNVFDYSLIDFTGNINTLSRYIEYYSLYYEDVKKSLTQT